jgi:hypothetical protein
MSAAAPEPPVEEENFQLVWHNHQTNFHEVNNSGPILLNFAVFFFISGPFKKKLNLVDFF